VLLRIPIMRLPPALGTCTVLGIVFLLVTHAWEARSIEPLIVQDGATYCRNWQGELGSKTAEFRESCAGQADRSCGQWKLDLDAQTARFSSRCQ
jgi:hypothetical protein